MTGELVNVGAALFSATANEANHISSNVVNTDFLNKVRRWFTSTTILLCLSRLSHFVLIVKIANR